MSNKHLTPTYPLFSYDATHNQLTLDGMEQPSVVVRDSLQVHLDFVKTSCELPSTIKIWGQILNECGQPISYLLVSLYRRFYQEQDYEPVGSVFTDANGWYVFEVEDYRCPVCYTLTPHVDSTHQHHHAYSQSASFLEPSSEVISNKTTSNQTSFNDTATLYVAQNRPLNNEQEL